MGYQALVFCPDEKTARTVTQVLTELDFAVEACTEPFAAVKKLMGQHFDAVVVDCDNEQNATLLFKSARNSSSNQASLAVAVVEGQAGVAKAFRIGANLVLTKPINIEQAKGTVRVARGLLRKSEPGKSASATPVAPTAPAVTPAKPPAPKPFLAAKPVEPVAPKPVSKTVAPEIPTSKPAPQPAWPDAPAAKSAPVARTDEPVDIDLEESVAAAPPKTTSAISHAEKLPEPQAPAKPAFAPAAHATSGGAASAPAPARKPDVTEKPQESKAADAVIEQPVEKMHDDSSPVVGSTPSFSFGGATAESASSGGSKKILLAVAAAVVIGAVAYLGWSQFQGHSNQATPTHAPVTAPVAQPLQAKPAAVQPSSAATPGQKAPATAVQTPEITLSTPPTSDSNDDVERFPKGTANHSAGSASKPTAATPSKPDAEPAPLVVKSGKVPAAQSKASATDAPPPSLIGMAASAAVAPPPNLVPSANSAFKPTLQTVNISQGVSQGLLVRKVSPSYPANAMRMRIEGSVQLLATISKDGNIAQIKVLSGDAQLTRAATDAVKQWKYKPYLLNGEPVDIQTQVTINFRLPR
jgi:TonB family protein